MAETEIWEAAKERLATTAGLTAEIYWPGQAKGEDAPRYEVAMGPGATRTLGFSGLTDVRLTMIVTAVTRVDNRDFTLTSNTMVKAIVERFPFGTFLGDTNGQVIRRPSIGGAFQDGSEYRVPITIFIRSFLTPSD